MEILKNIKFKYTIETKETIENIFRYNLTDEFRKSNQYTFNENNLPNDQPKVIVKNNLLFFYCPFCNQLHSAKIANSPNNDLPMIDYDEIPKDTWMWNENLIEPTFYQCLHIYIKPLHTCDVYIKDGYIYKTTEKSLFELFLDNPKTFQQNMKHYTELNNTTHTATFDIITNYFNSLYDTNKLPDLIPHVIPMLPINKWPVKIA